MAMCDTFRIGIRDNTNNGAPEGSWCVKGKIEAAWAEPTGNVNQQCAD
jgi:hypothetical protein